MDADDTVLVIVACLFGGASIVMFILGLALGRIKGTKQTVRWVAALLALVACGVTATSLALEQPQWDRSVDGVTRVWGRWANWAFSYTLIALTLTLGCMVRLRDIITYPICMFMAYIFLLFGSLPNAGPSSWQHWIWFLFAGITTVCAIFSLFYVDFGIGYDSKADVEAQKAVYSKEGSFGYRRGTVVAIKIVWVAITIFQHLFWSLAQETSGVFGYFVSTLISELLNVFAVGVGAFLLFWIMDPERNAVLRSPDHSNAASAAQGDLEEGGDSSATTDETAHLAGDAASTSGAAPAPAPSQSTIDTNRATNVASSIYSGATGQPAGKAVKLNYY
jgi:hypothetical protein